MEEENQQQVTTEEPQQVTTKDPKREEQAQLERTTAE